MAVWDLPRPRRRLKQQLGEAEGAPISLLRKWPHKSDRETHLWMLVKVLLLITSKVSEAEGGSWEMESSRPGSRWQLPEQLSWGLPGGLKQPQLPAAPLTLTWGPPRWGTDPVLSPLCEMETASLSPLVPVSSRSLAIPSSPNPPLPGATTPVRWHQLSFSPLRDGPKWALYFLGLSRQPLPLLSRGLFLFGDPQGL